MGEEELGELVLRLSGDMAEMKAMWEEAADVTEDAAGEVEDAAGQVEDSAKEAGESWGEMAVKAAAAAGMLATLKEAFGNFAEAESIGIRLNAVLEANGRDVKALTATYQAYAAQRERTTRMEDDATLQLLAQAESFNLTGRAAMNAVDAAVALAAVNDGNAQSYLRFTAAMARGDTQTAMAFARMIPQLRGIRDEREFMAKAQLLVATGMRTERDLMASSSGQLQVLKRDFGNLLEELGAFVAEGVMPVVHWMREAVTWFRTLSPEVRQTVTAMLGLVAGFVSLSGAISLTKLLLFGLFANPLVLAIGAVTAAAVLFKDELFGAVDVFEMLEFSAQQFGRVWDVAVTSAALKLSEFKDFAEDFLPALGAALASAFGLEAGSGGGATESGATRVLRADLARLTSGLVGSYDEFRRARHAALGPPGAAPVDPFANAATSVAEIKADLKEIGSFDAALSGTAEALSRVAEYANRRSVVRRGSLSQEQFTAVRGALGSIASVASDIGGDSVVRQLVDVLNRLANRPGAVLAPAEVR